jgi:molecular chaperone HtpG
MAEAETRTDSFEFKAEIKQLLDILARSLYTNREIFLRELISNASDALEKLRFEQGKGAEIADPDLDLEIRIDPDGSENTLTITDTGIGMTRDEIVKDLGTIAHSGSSELVRRAAETGETVESLIGRFGVGFYSVFMAADEVTVVSRPASKRAKPVAWKSDGGGAYEVWRPEAQDVPRGTSVTLKLRDDAREFADKETVKDIIRRHSNFVSFPISVAGERVNTVPAIWREPKFNVTAEQYEEFYKFLTHDAEGPMETMHVSVDAPVQYNALLFIPEKSMRLPGMHFEEERGPDLYVRRVLIQHQYKELIPRHLAFVRGVVDTEDLPLNISRETLQDNLLIRKIASNLTKQVMDKLSKMAEENPEDYETFWREHSEIFKAGYADFSIDREKYASLLRFNSSALEDAKALTSLDEYVSRAKPEQKTIYYVSAPSHEAARLSPHLEVFRRKGVEVLYLFDPIDEFNMDAIRTYKDYEIRSAEHPNMDELDKFEDVEKAEQEQLSEEERGDLKGLLGKMREVLGERVTEVRASDRLTESPVVLLSPDGQVTSSMERVMRLMTKDQSVPKKLVEVNPTHPLIKNLLGVYRQDPDDDFVKQATEQLYESALLLEGYLTDPHALVGRIQDLLTKSSGWYRENAEK